jgi:hypothetical protein
MRAHEFMEGTIKLRGFGPQTVNPDAPATKFLRAVEEQCSFNPMNDHQLVYKNVAVIDVIRDFYDKEGAVELKDIRAIVKGGGAQAMEMLCGLADEFGCKLTLFAKGYAHVPTAKLYQYYQRFGFKSEFEARPEDLEHDGIEMERQPS